jgi:hypothetical protein
MKVCYDFEDHLVKFEKEINEIKEENKEIKEENKQIKEQIKDQNEIINEYFEKIEKDNHLRRKNNLIADLVSCLYKIFVIYNDADDNVSIYIDMDENKAITIKQNFFKNLKNELIDSQQFLNLDDEDMNIQSNIDLLVTKINEKSILYKKIFEFWKNKGLSPSNLLKLIFIKINRNQETHFNFNIRKKSDMANFIEKMQKYETVLVNKLNDDNELSIILLSSIKKFKS